MARMHILQRIGPNLYDAVIHAPVPDGTSSAGIAWSAAIVAAGLNVTSLKTGKGGQITDEEAAQIAAGTVIERRIQWGEDEGHPDVVAVAKDVADGKVAGAAAVTMLDAANAQVRSAYLDREVGELIKVTLERLDRFGETVA